MNYNEAIYKYVIPFGNDPVNIEMMPDARIVHVDMQGEDIYLWVIFPRCYEEDKKDTRTFQIVATGQDFNGFYVGTVLEDARFVWHVIELEN
jgi:hypothetical protein